MKKAIFTALILSLTANLAEARHFKVYGYNTLEADEVELVYWTDYVAKSDNTMNYFGKTGVKREGLWSHTLELEYGLTDRLTVAAYADFEQPSGEDLKYIQTRVVAARYRFGEAGKRFFDTALYVEYYFPNQNYQGEAKEKIEARLILEKKINGKTLRINPKLEKVTSGPDVDEGLEFEYGASLYGPWTSKLQWGLELYGSLGELSNTKPWDKQKHYIVPAMTYKLSKHLKWNIGAAFGLTDASDDLVFKSLLEWEL
ncbi:MAG TPA: hypothetical protein ENI80_06825 [Acidiferrobacteraceae bacterium]|mgnify:CR=1 FL=1|nr:hypothetical protein [Acidiferrobacteraceae bacterium]